MMIKRYVENFITQCSDQKFGQDAVEWAILQGRLTLTFHLATDLAAVHAPLPAEAQTPGEKPLTRYDQLIEEFQLETRGQVELLMASYAPLLEQILPQAA